MQSQNNTQGTFLARISITASGIAVLIALVVIGAWWSGNVVIASISSEYVPMTLSIALSVLLLAGAVVLNMHVRAESKIVLVPIIMALLVLVVSILVLSEIAAGLQSDIDRLLGATNKTVEGYELAESSPISTITLLAASLAAVLSFGRTLSRSWRPVISALSLFTFSVGILITLGYVYGSPLLYGGDVRPVSLLAGISYGLLGIILLTFQGPQMWPASAFVGSSVRARLLRAFVPIIVFVVLLSGSLSNRALSTSSNPALTAALIALMTAIAVGYIVTRLSTRIGGQIDETNAMLLKTQNELKQANEKLNVLGSITRHDTLNWLAVVLGRLEMLEARTQDKETLRQIKETYVAAQTIQRIIQFTGEYQRIGASGPIWIDVEEAFREAIRGVNHETISVKAEVTGVEVLADQMFEKVLANLVDNSQRHGKNLTAIRLHYNKERDGLVLIYEDDGGGLTAEDKANLFKRGHGKHTGLGTFLSKNILEFSGMSIHETGEYGVGSRFEINVPTDRYRIKGE